VAEILIQRKRRRRVWPWLLGLLVLALLPWPFLGNRDDGTAARARIARGDTVVGRDTVARRDTVAQRDTTTRTTAIAAGTIAPAATTPPTTPPTKTDTVAAPASPAATGTSFERFIAAGSPNADERAHRRYTANGLRRLADELRALGASDAGVRAIRVNADSVASTAQGSARPDYARAAFLAAVREIDLLGGRYAVAVDTGRLRAAAWAIEPDRRLLAQRGRVQTFFEAARDALHSVSKRR
jgi:hypothetical protein